jgi:hypothetical protein
MQNPFPSSPFSRISLLAYIAIILYASWFRSPAGRQTACPLCRMSSDNGRVTGRYLMQSPM